MFGLEYKNQSMSEFSSEFSKQAYFLRRGVVSPTPNPQDGGAPLVGCPRLHIQYILSYSSYLEAVSIHNLRTRHAVVIMDTLSIAIIMERKAKNLRWV
jgi:hypothetical protein